LYNALLSLYCITTTMAFPGGHVGIPGGAGQQQQANMSEQDMRMVKMV